MGKLFLVATPIGNLEDITLRALRTLREVSLIAAEDTRTTRKLLSHYDIHTPVTSYNDDNKAKKTPFVLQRLSEGDVALVSEAGTPGISDPGRELVAAANAAGVQVVPVPGPSAVTAAIAASGVGPRGFTFVGFPPRQASQRRRLFHSLRDRDETLVLFEAPHRLIGTLADLRSELGDRRVVVCRELTKLHEEVFRGRVSEAQERFREPRGEFTLVVAPPEEGQVPEQGDRQDEAAIIEEMRRLRDEGRSAQETMRLLSERHSVSRRRLYRLWLGLQ
ncbi:MAG: 16S rRNA (cytidine(1402)-2'-O)-methyltransferase [Dehalococcoidia bacterium]|nr:16S rRNA (cytidine(1402)-2'-O)-methyltransferase [Dehalococcoidia bacterium]